MKLNAKGLTSIASKMNKQTSTQIPYKSHFLSSRATSSKGAKEVTPWITPENSDFLDFYFCLSFFSPHLLPTHTCQKTILYSYVLVFVAHNNRVHL